MFNIYQMSTLICSRKNENCSLAGHCLVRPGVERFDQFAFWVLLSERSQFKLVDYTRTNVHTDKERKRLERKEPKVLLIDRDERLSGKYSKALYVQTQ